MLQILLLTAVVRHVESSEDTFLLKDAINHEASGKIVETSISTTTHNIPIGLTTQRQANGTTNRTKIFLRSNTIIHNGTRTATLNHGNHKTKHLLSHLPFLAAPVMPLVARLVMVTNKLQHNMRRN